MSRAWGDAGDGQPLFVDAHDGVDGFGKTAQVIQCFCGGGPGIRRDEFVVKLERVGNAKKIAMRRCAPTHQPSVGMALGSWWESGGH